MNLFVVIIAIIFVFMNLSVETKTAIINDVKNGTIEIIKNSIEQIKNGDRK